MASGIGNTRSGQIQTYSVDPGTAGVKAQRVPGFVHQNRGDQRSKKASVIKKVERREQKQEARADGQELFFHQALI